MIKYFIFTGPECSGKTTLANIVARHKDLPLVQEYARIFLSELDRKYTDHDLNLIAKGQEKLENQYADNFPIVCDTDLLTLFIWRAEVFKNCDLNWADKLKNSYKEDRLYILCMSDVAWEYDPLRENPHDRERLFQIYEDIMQKFGLNYVVVKGSVEARMEILQKYLPK